MQPSGEHLLLLGFVVLPWEGPAPRGTGLAQWASAKKGGTKPLGCHPLPQLRVVLAPRAPVQEDSCPSPRPSAPAARSSGRAAPLSPVPTSTLVWGL